MGRLDQWWSSKWEGGRQANEARRKECFTATRSPLLPLLFPVVILVQGTDFRLNFCPEETVLKGNNVQELCGQLTVINNEIRRIIEVIRFYYHWIKNPPRIHVSSFSKVILSSHLDLSKTEFMNLCFHLCYLVKTTHGNVTGFLIWNSPTLTQTRFWLPCECVTITRLDDCVKLKQNKILTPKLRPESECNLLNYLFVIVVVPLWCRCSSTENHGFSPS